MYDFRQIEQPQVGRNEAMRNFITSHAREAGAFVLTTLALGGGTALELATAEPVRAQAVPIGEQPDPTPTPGPTQPTPVVEAFVPDAAVEQGCEKLPSSIVPTDEKRPMWRFHDTMKGKTRKKIDWAIQYEAKASAAGVDIGVCEADYGTLVVKARPQRFKKSDQKKRHSVNLGPAITVDKTAMIGADYQLGYKVQKLPKPITRFPKGKANSGTVTVTWTPKPEVGGKRVVWKTKKVHGATR
jgi:hypothetical protein